MQKGSDLNRLLVSYLFSLFDVTDAAAREVKSANFPCELELELIQSHMAQKPVLWGEVGCACVAREVSAQAVYGSREGCVKEK